MMIHNQMLLSTGTNNGCEPLCLLRIVNLQNEPSIMPYLPTITSLCLLVGNCAFWYVPTYIFVDVLCHPFFPSSRQSRQLKGQQRVRHCVAAVAILVLAI